MGVEARWIVRRRMLNVLGRQLNPKKEKKMNITRTTIAVAALFAAASVCQAALRATSSDDEKTETATEQTSGEERSSSVDLSELDNEDTLTFSIDDEFPETIDGHEVLSDFLPEGVMLEWTGKTLKAPKAGKVKYSKKDEGFVDSKDSENPSGLKAKLNKKKGTISGSFKVYVAKSEKKLKSYSAKFSGKIGGTIKITVKGKTVATATIE